MSTPFWESRLDVKASELEDKQSNSSIPQDYGLCSKCSRFAYRKTKLMDIEVICNAYMETNVYMRTKPRTYDPIIECSFFWARGQMSIESMSKIAYIIDIKKRQIGFSGETVEVIITEPKDEEDDKK